MGVLRFGLAFCLGWAVLAGMPAQAQDRAVEPVATSAERETEATADLSDFWRKIRHKDEAAQPDVAAARGNRVLVVAPAIGSKPARVSSTTRPRRPASACGCCVNKRSRTSFCTDRPWGRSDSRGFYLGLQEAF
jgi:hypothetical protein